PRLRRCSARSAVSTRSCINSLSSECAAARGSANAGGKSRSSSMSLGRKRISSPKFVRRGCRAGRAYAPGYGALALTLALGGCMVGPNYQRPEAQVNDAWQAQTGPSAEQAAADARWWDLFSDRTLSLLIEHACGQNLGLRVAGLRVLEARAARGIAVGQF